MGVGVLTRSSRLTLRRSERPCSLSRIWSTVLRRYWPETCTGTEHDLQTTTTSSFCGVTAGCNGSGKRPRDGWLGRSDLLDDGDGWLEHRRLVAMDHVRDGVAVRERNLGRHLPRNGGVTAQCNGRLAGATAG